MSQIVDVKHDEICTLLQSDEKFKRKEALKDILKDVIESVQSTDDKVLLELWEVFHRPVVRVLNDQAEACRDLALDILKEFLEHLPCSDKNIVYIIPILTKRLGSQELIEQSEEVRLKCIVLLKTIVRKHQDKLTEYFGDFVTILSRTVTDKYPNVKKESCECICDVARAMPSNFYTKSEVFIKPILFNIAHQHYKIRVITVNTIGEVLLFGNSKSMDSVAGPLAERLFDQSGAVRSAVVDVAGKWMVDLKDRYSWWCKLVPLLLTGINDVVPEIQQKAFTLWLAAGEKYVEENESDKKFKEKLDFFDDDPKHYPPNIERANLGCRTIVQQNFSKFLGALSRELNDWMADIKVRAAQLLCILALNLESEVTHHFEKLLLPMYRACNDEDKRVVENIEAAAEYMGYFVPPKTFCEHILPALKNNPTIGHLKVFSALVRGSPRKLLTPELPAIGKLLKESNVKENRKPYYQMEVLKCCESIFKICQEDCSEIARDLFSTIFIILALSSESLVEETAKTSLILLAKSEDMENLDKLFEKYIETMISSVQSNPESWTISTYEFLVFKACIIHARNATYKQLNLIHPIFEKTVLEDSDKKLQLKQYILLSDYIQQWDKPEEKEGVKSFTDFANTILEKVIIPGLKWSAGRSAEAIRTASVCCLCALLNKIMSNCEENKKTEEDKGFSLTVEHFGWLFEKVRPILVKLIDDDAYKTRLYSLQAMCLIMNIGQELSYIAEEHIHKVSPEIVTRLEDEHDEVRLAGIEALKEIWKVLPKDYDLSFFHVHIDYVYEKMLTHLDDPGEKFQKQVLECLMSLLVIHPELFLERIEKSRNNFINQKALDQLASVAQDRLKGSKATN